MGIVKFLGKCMLAATIFYFGWQLYTVPELRAEAGQRTVAVWDHIRHKHEKFQDFHGHVHGNLEMIVKVMMWCLLSAPAFILCRWLAIPSVMAFAFYSMCFFNPTLSGEMMTNLKPATNVVCLKAIGVMGALVYMICNTPLTVAKTSLKKK